MYLEFRIGHLEYQTRICNSEYVFGIPNNIFQSLNFEFRWRFQAFVNNSKCILYVFLYLTKIPVHTRCYCIPGTPYDG